jgi:hypothetical protein
MSAHRFAIGETVRLKSRSGLSPSTPELFQITALMPLRGDTFQYRMRNDEERHERVAGEDDIEPGGDNSAINAANSNIPGTGRSQ